MSEIENPDHEIRHPGLSSLIIEDDEIQQEFASVNTALKQTIVTTFGDDGSAAGRRSGGGDAEKALFDGILTRDETESKYEIKRKVATGGMGAIYYVYDRDIKRHVILKVMLTENKTQIETIKRFVYEAWITGRLEHPNTITVHDFGYLPGYGIFFTMTYVDGESLCDVIDHLIDKDEKYVKKYDVRQLIDIFRKVCDAVEYAHSREIIHRDIKPENIMVGKFGEVLLMDWGLAKFRGDAEPEAPSENYSEILDLTATADGVVKGTPCYMSPEQAWGHPGSIDKQSDIFLLGATLYHLITLELPYYNHDLKELLRAAHKGIFTPPEDLCKSNEQVSQELCRIIRKAMAPKKVDRYETVRELSADLDALIRGTMRSERRVFEKNAYLLREGDSGAESYVIVSGQVQVFRTLDEQKIVLSTLKEGDIVGDMALITDQPRTASAIALERTEVVVLSQARFKEYLSKLPSWLEHTIKTLANRLEDTSTKLSDSVVFDRNLVDSAPHPFQL